MVNKGKVSWRTVNRLVKDLGAEFAINKPTFQEMTELQRRVAQIAVNRRDGEMHLFSDKPTRVTVVWDRYFPPRAEVRSIVQRTLASGRVPSDETSHIWAVPLALTRPPLASEIALHRASTMAAIAATNCEHVVLLGKSVIQMWRSDFKPMAVAGDAFVWGSKYVYPMIHPGAILADVGNLRVWQEGLRQLSRGVHTGEVEWAKMCVKCGYAAEVYDEQAVPYCGNHFKIDNTQWRESRWVKETNKAQQMGMDL